MSIEYDKLNLRCKLNSILTNYAYVDVDDIEILIYDSGILEELNNCYERSSLLDFSKYLSYRDIPSLNICYIVLTMLKDKYGFNKYSEELLWLTSVYYRKEDIPEKYFYINLLEDLLFSINVKNVNKSLNKSLMYFINYSYILKVIDCSFYQEILRLLKYYISKTDNKFKLITCIDSTYYIDKYVKRLYDEIEDEFLDYIKNYQLLNIKLNGLIRLNNTFTSFMFSYFYNNCSYFNDLINKISNECESYIDFRCIILNEIRENKINPNFIIPIYSFYNEYFSLKDIIISIVKDIKFYDIDIYTKFDIINCINFYIWIEYKNNPISLNSLIIFILMTISLNYSMYKDFDVSLLSKDFITYLEQYDFMSFEDFDLIYDIVENMEYYLK